MNEEPVDNPKRVCASVQRVSSVDGFGLATVLGYQGQCSGVYAGDLVVLVEPSVTVQTEGPFAHLSKAPSLAPHDYLLQEALIVPLPEGWPTEVGTDVSELAKARRAGVKRKSGSAKKADGNGSWPHDAPPKTDEVRFESLHPFIRYALSSPDAECTLKLDGMSITAYVRDDGEKVICTRNQQVTSGAAYEHMVRLGICDKLVGGEAVQGELVGPGIQGNPHKFPEVRFYAHGYWGPWDDTHRSRLPLCLVPDGIQRAPNTSPLVVTGGTCSGVGDICHGGSGPIEGVVLRAPIAPGVPHISAKLLNKGYRQK